jgi:hypothetical protein
LRRACAVSFGIGPRGVEIEGVAQVPVNERMLAGDLGTGSARHLTSDTQRFDNRDRHARAAERVGGGKSDDSGSDDSDIRADRFVESRIRRLQCRRSPATVSRAGEVNDGFSFLQIKMSKKS